MTYPHQASALTGEEVLTTLSQDQRFGYVTGIIDALAYAQFLEEKPSEKGMKCRLDWFYKDGVESWKIMKKWFENNPSQHAFVVINTILNRECGR